MESNMQTQDKLVNCPPNSIESRWVLITGWVLGFIFIAGCQPQPRPTVSLLEAKKISTEFEGSSYETPPRTIADIEALLDENTLTNWDRIQADRRIADALPPTSTSPLELAGFYRERAKAAIFVGRFTQARKDLLRTLEILHSAGINQTDDTVLNESEIHADLAHAEQVSGRLGQWLQHAHRRLQIRVQQGRDTSPALHTIPATAAAALGSLEEAKAQIETAKSKLHNTYSWNNGFDVIVQSMVPGAEGRVLDFQGQHLEAEPLLRKSIDMIRRDRNSGKDPSHQPLRYSLGDAWVVTETETLNWLSQNLIGQGRLTEAELVARESVKINVTRWGRYSPYTARSLNRMNQAVSAQGRYEDSRRLAEEVLEILDKVGVPPGAWERAQAQANIAGNEMLVGHWQRARTILNDLRAEMSREDVSAYKAQFRGDPNFGLALIKTGAANEAAEILAQEYASKRTLLGAKHYRTAELGGLLAMARATLNQHDAALAGFRKSVPILIQRSRALATTSGGALQRLRRKLILETYLDLLADKNLAGEAFTIADTLKGSTVQTAVTAASARAAARNPELSDLVRREQDAQQQIAALNALLSNAANTGDLKSVQDLRSRVDRLRGARATLAKEIEGRFPEYAELVRPKPGTLAETAKALRSGEALIATYVGNSRSYVWAVPQSGQTAFASVAIGLKEMTTRVAHLRASLDPQAETLGDIPVFDVTAAHELYRQVLAPVAAGWKDSKSLLVVAHGPLGYLPLALLPTRTSSVDHDALPLFAGYRSVPWLTRSHAITNLPSVAALRALRSNPVPVTGRQAFAGFGDPWFRPEHATAVASATTTQLSSRGSLKLRSFPVTLRTAPKTRAVNSADITRLPRLAETAQELRSIAMALNANPSSSVFTGKQASERRVKNMDLSKVRVLAFATHGLVPGDLDGLTQPALALSAPSITGESGDGLLTLDEILSLRLDADWVVLSACNTGSADGAGAEAVSGLGRAFFYAGSRALLVSNWPVETTSAKALTTQLFRQQAGAATHRAEALRRSMTTLMDGPGYLDSENKAVFSYAHPIFWAPFSVIGDSGTGNL